MKLFPPFLRPGSLGSFWIVVVVGVGRNVDGSAEELSFEFAKFHEHVVEFGRVFLLGDSAYFRGGCCGGMALFVLPLILLFVVSAVPLMVATGFCA